MKEAQTKRCLHLLWACRQVRVSRIHGSAIASNEGIAGFLWSLAKLGSWAHVKGPHAYSFPVPTRKGAPVVATSVFLLRTSVPDFRVFLLSLGPNVDWLRTYKKITLGFRDLLGKLLKILFLVKVSGVTDNMGLREPSGL